MWKYLSPRWWVSLFEKLLVKSEDRPVLRALIIPIIATHIIPLGPVSFIVYIGLPTGMVAYFTKYAVHSYDPIVLIGMFALSELIVYSITVLICIPLTPTILRNSIKFTRYLDGVLFKIEQFSKDVLSKMNGKDK